ncbi:MAG: 30S ribosomal protein S16 [Chloroflexi bacterium]|nr:30S ribosomal protein S16 [Chloroflexota bacterium]
MPVKIRLRRVGAKKQPSYRVVVADSRAPRDGRFVEIIGFYNPLTNPETVSVKTDRARLWLQRGAQPTEAVERLLRKTGALPPRPLATETPSSSEALTESGAK